MSYIQEVNLYYNNLILYDRLLENEQFFHLEIKNMKVIFIF